MLKLNDALKYLTYPVIPPPNPCHPNPCKNGGECSSKGDRYICKCPEGYTGKHCEDGMGYVLSSEDTNTRHYFMVYFSENFFFHKNKKVNGIQDMALRSKGSSHSDWIMLKYLTFSEIPPPNPCRPNPCENGGSCVSEGSRYKCICADGYTGRHCESGMSYTCLLKILTNHTNLWLLEQFFSFIIINL